MSLRRDSVISSSSGQESVSAGQVAKEHAIKSGPWRPKWKESNEGPIDDMADDQTGIFRRKPTAKLDSIRKLGNWRAPTVIKDEEEADVAGLVERAGNIRLRN